MAAARSARDPLAIVSPVLVFSHIPKSSRANDRLFRNLYFSAQSMRKVKSRLLPALYFFSAVQQDCLLRRDTLSRGWGPGATIEIVSEHPDGAIGLGLER